MLGAIFYLIVRVLEGILRTNPVSYLMRFFSHGFLVVLTSIFCTSAIYECTL